MLNFCEYINNTTEMIDISYEIEPKKKYDLYIVLSDDIADITEKIKGIKNKRKIVIITKNKDINHIIQCVNITKNMYYLYSSNEYLLDKFIKANIINHTKSSSKK